MARRQPPFGNRNNHGHGRHTPRGTAASDQAAPPVEGPFVYDPYGLRARTDDSETPLDDSGQQWNYLYHSMPFDPAVYDFRTRAMSPTLQRWAQQDPLGYVEGVHQYPPPPLNEV